MIRTARKNMCLLLYAVDQGVFHLLVAAGNDTIAERHSYQFATLSTAEEQILVKSNANDQYILALTMKQQSTDIKNKRRHGLFIKKFSSASRSMYMRGW
eukprot:scaffold13057_cov75-Skeletonema_dohrnii-CCMP3373.AAC.4